MSATGRRAPMRAGIAVSATRAMSVPGVIPTSHRAGGLASLTWPPAS